MLGLVWSSRPRHRNQLSSSGCATCSRRCSEQLLCNTSGMSLSGPLWENMTSSTKPEVYNVSQRRRRKTEPGPRVACTTLVKIGCVVLEISSWTNGQTHRQTDRQTDYNTALRYGGGVINRGRFCVLSVQHTGHRV